MFTEAHRQALSEAAKRRYQDPEQLRLNREHWQAWHADPAHTAMRLDRMRAGMAGSSKMGRWNDATDDERTEGMLPLVAASQRAMRQRAEVQVLHVLERSHINFIWQHPMGRSVVDFYLPNHALALEIDGKEHRTAARMPKDQARDAALVRRFTIAVVRIPTRTITHDGAVVALRVYLACYPELAHRIS